MAMSPLSLSCCYQLRYCYHCSNGFHQPASPFCLVHACARWRVLHRAFCAWISRRAEAADHHAFTLHIFPERGELVCELYVRIGLDRCGMRYNLRCSVRPSLFEKAFPRAHESQSQRGVLGICTQIPRLLVIRHCQGE